MPRKNKEVERDRRRERWRSDPEWRQARLAQQAVRRARLALDPTWVERERARKRKENLSPDVLEQRRKYAREWRRKNLKVGKAWTAKHHEQTLLYSARHRAKKRGLAFDISVDDIKIPDLCPVLGIRLVRSRGKLFPESPTIDRIDNTKGYVKGNIAVISWRANTLKRDSTLEELERICQYLRASLPPLRLVG